ncbi:MAG: hypothetical protein A2267_02740 [Omnitrophica WOR_2 bacterium RIFOXYA12_FULL_38_10]|nr:MAG: hypothetical protein A2267_02740 [Omnitrophica WOR_2 bacterium RIFOXYA12_FULL_38_10]OGX59609.1 MAG: hypothetical protein A2447_12185 [Omnitrophica WOR_2 bacterium RIFOXYC2_FULL_38_12]
MNIASKQFTIYIFLTFLAFHITPIKTFKSLGIAILNITFLCLLAKSPYELIPLGLFLVFCFTAIKLIEKQCFKNAFLFLLLLLIGIFIYLKKYAFLFFVPFYNKPYLSIGFSFILFRVIHLMIDVNERQYKEKIGIFDFFNYVCFYLCYISGPIQSFKDFKAQLKDLNNKNIYFDFLIHCKRLVNGYLKILLIAPLFHIIYENLATSFYSNPQNIYTYFGASSFYYLYIYIYFAGYMDIIITIGQIIGFKLPENFNQPFRATSLLDFWSRWHITLSNWFKTFIFNPILKKLVIMNHSPKLFNLFGIIAYFITFFIVGLWHGSTFSSVIYGLLLGTGVSLNKLYDNLCRQKLSKENYSKLNNNIIFNTFTSGLTFSYMFISTSCLFLSAQRISWLIRSLSFTGLFATFAVGTMILAFIKLLLVAIEKPLLKLTKFLPENLKLYSSFLSLSIKFLAIIITALFFTDNTPQFIYQVL